MTLQILVVLDTLLADRQPSPVPLASPFLAVPLVVKNGSKILPDFP